MAALCCAIDRQRTVYRRVPSEMGNGPYTMRHKSVLRNSARRRPATLVDYFAVWLAKSSSLKSARGFGTRRDEVIIGQPLQFCVITSVVGCTRHRINGCQFTHTHTHTPRFILHTTDGTPIHSQQPLFPHSVRASTATKSGTLDIEI